MVVAVYYACYGELVDDVAQDTPGSNQAAFVVPIVGHLKLPDAAR